MFDLTTKLSQFQQNNVKKLEVLPFKRSLNLWSSQSLPDSACYELGKFGCIRFMDKIIVKDIRFCDESILCCSCDEYVLFFLVNCNPSGFILY